MSDQKIIGSNCCTLALQGKRCPCFVAEVSKNSRDRQGQMLAELVEAGDAMRGFQKTYFATRSRDVLNQAKAAEQRFDDLLKRYRDKQERLF